MSDFVHLLIFWTEGIEFYLLPKSEYEKHRNTLAAANNKLIGCDDDVEACLLINDLVGDPKYASEECPPGLAGTWAKYKVEVSELQEREIVGVTLTGCCP